MSDYRPTLSRNPYEGAAVEVVRNRVLRNTYWLLALSLIPTVLGAAVGMMSGINQVMATSPGITAIVFLLGAFGLMFAIEKNKDSSLGVGLLLLFTFFMGVMLASARFCFGYEQRNATGDVRLWWNSDCVWHHGNTCDFNQA